jgi:hypothetical protein
MCLSIGLIGLGLADGNLLFVYWYAPKSVSESV